MLTMQAWKNTLKVDEGVLSYFIHIYKHDIDPVLLHKTMCCFMATKIQIKCGRGFYGKSFQVVWFGADFWPGGPYYLDFLKVNKLFTMYDVNKVRTIHFYTKVHFLALLFMTCTIRTSSHSTFHIVVCSTVNLKHELDRSVTVTNPCFIRTLKP
jgi:hypothetical protein